MGEAVVEHQYKVRWGNACYDPCNPCVITLLLPAVTPGLHGARVVFKPSKPPPVSVPSRLHWDRAGTAHVNTTDASYDEIISSFQARRGGAASRGRRPSCSGLVHLPARQSWCVCARDAARWVGIGDALSIHAHVLLLCRPVCSGCAAAGEDDNNDFTHAAEEASGGAVEDEVDDDIGFRRHQPGERDPSWPASGPGSRGGVGARGTLKIDGICGCNCVVVRHWHRLEAPLQVRLPRRHPARR